MIKKIISFALISIMMMSAHAKNNEILELTYVNKNIKLDEVSFMKNKQNISQQYSIYGIVAKGAQGCSEIKRINPKKEIDNSLNTELYKGLTDGQNMGLVSRVWLGDNIVPIDTLQKECSKSEIKNVIKSEDKDFKETWKYAQQLAKKYCGKTDKCNKEIKDKLELVNSNGNETGDSGGFIMTLLYYINALGEQERNRLIKDKVIFGTGAIKHDGTINSFLKRIGVLKNNKREIFPVGSVGLKVVGITKLLTSAHQNKQNNGEIKNLFFIPICDGTACVFEHNELKKSLQTLKKQGFSFNCVSHYSGAYCSTILSQNDTNNNDEKHLEIIPIKNFEDAINYLEKDTKKEKQ